MATLTKIAETSNDAKRVIEAGMPYVATFKIKGTSAFLFHRWSVDGVEAKAKAAKGSKAKREDDLESYVYRTTDEGELAIPAEYFRMAFINAAKYKQDPRSPRKSAMDLFKAGLVVLDELCSLGKKNWDFIDRRRVQIQRSGITRSRPALLSGWEIELRVQVLLPEYVTVDLLHDVSQMAGKLIGVGDFRPTFGRFAVINFTVE